MPSILLPTVYNCPTTLRNIEPKPQTIKMGVSMFDGILVIYRNVESKNMYLPHVPHVPLLRDWGYWIIVASIFALDTIIGFCFRVATEAGIHEKRR